MFFAPKPPKMTPQPTTDTPAAQAAPLSFAGSPMRPAAQPAQQPVQQTPESTPAQAAAEYTPSFQIPTTEPAPAPQDVEPEITTIPDLPLISEAADDLDIASEIEDLEKALTTQMESIPNPDQSANPTIFSPSTPPPSFEEETPILDDPVFGTDDAVFEETVTETANPLDVMPEYESPAPVMESTRPLSAFAPPSSHQVEIEKEEKPEPVKTKRPEIEHMEPYVEKTETGKVLRATSLSDVPFADIWLTPENVAYVRDKDTKFALVPVETNDMDDFKKLLEEGYTGASSYALKFEGESYRVERVMTITGVQYNCRKMPTETPDIYTLGLPKSTVDYLVGLSQESGLILFGGPTGMGKTTTASALMHKYLENDGGFLYTIEDPPEMPLDGLYHAKNGGLGLCKQTPVENERWEDGLKSALRSKPRYILVGEIRTPEVASQALRAATSGHLVLSTIHANSVEDALNSMVKYASGAGLAESLVSDLLARGILAVVHQKLEGTTQLRPVIHTCFANPSPLVADQMRMAIRDGKINLATLMEAQATKLFQGKPLFREL